VLKDNEGKYFIAVDTHIQRVANRTGYVKGKTVEDLCDVQDNTENRHCNVFLEITLLCSLANSLKE
jgi:endonuclease III